MIFKTFKWNIDPSNLNITMTQSLTTDYLPLLGHSQKNVGSYRKVIEGSSEFVGRDCLKQFSALSDLFMEPSSGQLLIPPLPPIKAFFVELAITSSPSPNIISYKFKFIEDCNHRSHNTPTTQSSYYIKQGESLWDIANKFDIDINLIMKHNPTIPSPYDIIPGSKIKLC